MSEWKEGIWIAVSAILVSIFLLLLTTVVMAMRESAKIEQEKNDNILVLRETFKTGRYDNTLVGQDAVINCIKEYKSGIPDVIVDNRIVDDKPAALFNLNMSADFILYHTWNLANPYYRWDGKVPSTSPDYNTDQLIDYIPGNALYRARILRDSSNAVIRIWFTRVASWNSLNNKKAKGSTIINCINESRGLSTPIRLRQNIGFWDTDDNPEYNLVWDKYSPYDYYSVNYLSSVIAAEGYYQCRILADSNGNILYTWFGKLE